MKTLFALAVVLTFASAVPADSLSQGQIFQELKQGALPLGPGVGNQLAKNLIDAQLTYISYTQFEPDSLQLSINAVLKAISIYVWPGGPTAITSQQAEPIVWAQSEIAIDTRVSVSLSPTSIDFGEQPIVSTSEPSTLWLLLPSCLVFYRKR